MHNSSVCTKAELAKRQQLHKGKGGAKDTKAMMARRQWAAQRRCPSRGDAGIKAQRQWWYKEVRREWWHKKAVVAQKFMPFD